MPTSTAFSLPVLDPARERDACGIGFVADASGRRSHRVLRLALEALAGLDHRGAVAADGRTSDGTGVLLHLPHALLRRELGRLGFAGVSSLDDEDLAVAQCFLPADGPAARRLVAEVAAEGGLRLLAWRTVPTDPQVLGPQAHRSRPVVAQAILCREDDDLVDQDAYERRLYLCRRRIEKRAAAAGLEIHLTSMSHRTVVYKSMARAADLPLFYPDLRDPEVRTGVALFHQRFSTNTSPSWRLAQPFRLLAHNGEINTIQGNLAWMSSRESELRSDLFGDELADLLPVLDPSASDSAMLDQMLELLVACGRDPRHALAMLLPEASREESRKDANLRAFYDVHQCLLEPWDGPAAVVATDGQTAVATLDRNGLRPQRYWRTADGLVLVGSEAGMVDLPDEEIVEKGRLGPGQMLSVDVSGRQTAPDASFQDDRRIKAELARSGPWRRWLARHVAEPPADLEIPAPAEDVAGARDEAELVRRQRAFGWSTEAMQRILDPMIEGKQPVGSMGNDAPLAVLSTQPQLLYSYFKQRFAQVTNPPIDPLRERLVFDLDVIVGGWSNLLDPPGDRPGPLVRFPSPVLSTAQFRWLLQADDVALRPVTFDCTWPKSEGVDGLRPAVEALADEAQRAVEDGAVLLVLSDRGVDAERAPIPMLLATSAVHHRLVRQRTRMRVSIVCDTGEPREDHHVACLIGYGATLVHPWMAYAACRRRGEEDQATDPVQAYRATLENGLLKVLSRLGVCPMSSYHGAQLFEALGLDGDFVDRCFPGTPSRVGGVGPKVLASDVLALHAEAYPETSTSEPSLVDRGFFRYRRGGEDHGFHPKVFTALHKAVRTKDQDAFRAYTDLVDQGPVARLRDLLTLRYASGEPGSRPLELDQVEPAIDIARRFVTAAMSHGALSREAHEVLAIGMNRLGARSNSGEGGEDPARFVPYGGSEGSEPEFLGAYRPAVGDWARSAVKQVASGRFGVTPYYLVSARELEIKMAQGSKPGEGGQIPGHKVTAEIAALRGAVPGMKLISPPPHHDIYSIEDLAQLIYDLKRVNARARVGVKLVSVAGVGTIAAGVAKAGADAILISGDDGGTGASPLSSIKHAGMPWELGLAETHRTLVEHRLRRRVTLRVDGGLKTGRDLVVGALLGAEEFAFGTAPLVAIGCVMARQCHLDTCPVGIATQRDDLRRKFPGTPEHVVSFMLFVAEQVRHELARLGVPRLADLVGRVDLLATAEERAPVRGLDLSEMIRPPRREAGAALGPGADRGTGGRNPEIRSDPATGPEPCLDERLVRDALRALESRTESDVCLTYPIRHGDRSVGARLSGKIAETTKGRGLPEGTVRVDFEGAAGQSFGVFLSPGLDLRLFGEAQDYVGKGMAGGRIVLRPPRSAARGPRRRPENHVIAGNTLLYGATGGRFFASGRVGERFCVRASGVRAVAEGCGDHGCEYMTRGVAVLLGPVGRNFGAGMGGGVAYLWDPERSAKGLIHRESVEVHDVAAQTETELLDLLREHAELTRSPLAEEILAAWPASSAGFVRVVPIGADSDRAFVAGDTEMAVEAQGVVLEV